MKGSTWVNEKPESMTVQQDGCVTAPSVDDENDDDDDADADADDDDDDEEDGWCCCGGACANSYAENHAAGRRKQR